MTRSFTNWLISMMNEETAFSHLLWLVYVIFVKVKSLMVNSLNFSTLKTATSVLIIYGIKDKEHD